MERVTQESNRIRENIKVNRNNISKVNKWYSSGMYKKCRKQDYQNKYCNGSQKEEDNYVGLGETGKVV